jgi:hypothetical protein
MAHKPVRATASLPRAVDLAAGARLSLVRMRDPGVRLRRRQRRARWGVAMRAVPTTVLGGLAVQAVVTGDPIAGACLAAVSAGGAWVTAMATRHAWDLHRLPIPAARPARPPRGSAARAAVDRLDAEQVELGQLLGLLGEPGGYTALAAADAANALRQCAARVVAVEAASAGASRAERRADPAVADLVARLDAGVAAHGQLVRAAADAVAASAGIPEASARQRIEDETDRLRGLALGFAELDPGTGRKRRLPSLTGERGDQIGRGGVGIRLPGHDSGRRR